MDKKSKNTLIISVIALALVLIGVTYAYFSARITGLESASTISLTAGRMGIVYSEDDASIIANNIYPREEEWVTKTITLTGTNTTDQEMKYELGLNIIENTFKGGQLTFDLTGVGSNGTKISNIDNKAIPKPSGFFKIGTGSFAQANGDTHIYTIKIYFKDNGKDQNINQEAVFNAKFNVREQGSQVAKANQNHNGKHCYTNDYVEGVTPADETEYVNGQYTYRYNQYYYYDDWNDEPSPNGWGVRITDASSDSPITTELCSYINERPVTSMAGMFTDSQATSVDLSSFDTSNVTDMRSMFELSQFTSLDLSSFDTSNVTDMSSMFSQSQAASLDLSSFDTSNVTCMWNMFISAAATSIDLSSFDTSNVTNMSRMFWGTDITSLDLSHFDTSNVTNMSGMFSQSRFSSLDLSSFDTASVTNMSGMFAYSATSSIDISSFNTSSVTDMSNMFLYSSATYIDVSRFDTSNVTTMQSMFQSSAATSLNLSSFDTSSVTFMNSMFQNSHVTSLDLSTFDTSSVTQMVYMFKDASTTTGYARTQADADRFNNVPGSMAAGDNPRTNIPNTLHFVVK